MLTTAGQRVQWWQQPLDVTNSWEALPSHSTAAARRGHGSEPIILALVTTLDIMSQVEIFVSSKSYK